jgi:chorismate mutase/prephenate dehydratase
MSETEDRIAALRRRIDAVDSQILDLLNRRADLVIEIGKAKAEERLAFHAPQREEQIHARLAAVNRGPFPTAALRPVFREIISACLSLEHPLRVAYFGPKATFTHQACMKQFGLSAEYIPARTIPDVFGEVEKGRADYGVVPIESSTEGVVTHTLDMFAASELTICGEILLEVSHHLLSRGGELGAIAKIYSHPQAIAQTRRWIAEHVAHVPVLEATSTAAAAEMAAEDPSAAAIASEMAAALYGLDFVARRIEDHAGSFTRFLVMGRTPAAPTEHDKTSLMVSIHDRVGGLYRMLKPFADHGINLTKIESRPSKRRLGEYIFYLDLEGNLAEPRVQRALEALRGESLLVKSLGSYPRAGGDAA